MKKDTWSDYHKITKNRHPRKLLIEALMYVKTKGKALDVGAGALTDSLFLLKSGFEVDAVDSAESSQDLANEISNSNFKFTQSSYENFNFKPETYDLISAQFSLPFSKAETFDEIFGKLINSLKKGGIFNGQLFGTNDEWNRSDTNMTFHSKEKVEKLLSDLNIIKLLETEKDGPTANGHIKHWHIFDIIAEKEK